MRSLQDIDAEITQTRDELIALRRQRNHLSATQRLPPEVLVRILRLTDEDRSWLNAGDGHGEYKVTRPLTWMAVLHVCSRWREICFNFPAYWTSVPTWNSHWMELALSRSGAAPIDLYYGLNTKDYPLSSTAALRHLDRVRTLRVEHPKFAERDTWFVPFMTKHPAPLLEYFEYGPIGMQFTLSRLDYLNMDPLDLADISLFQGVVPQLHSLGLTLVGLPPSSALLVPTLSYLNLNCIPRRWRWTYPQLRDVLERLPRLQDLRLHNALPLCTSAATAPSSQLELPRLVHVSLGIERCPEARDFFTHFVVPPTAFVEVESDCSHPHPEEVFEDIENEDIYPPLPEDDVPPHQRLIEAVRMHTHGVGSDGPREGMQPVRHLHAEVSINSMRFGLDGHPCAEVEFDCEKSVNFDPLPWDEDPGYHIPHIVLDSYTPGPHPISPEAISATEAAPHLAVEIPWLVNQLAVQLSGASVDSHEEAPAIDDASGSGYSPLAHALGVIARDWSLDYLETMTISGSRNAIPLADWQRIFSDCPRLYKLCVHGDAGAVALLCALLQGDGSGLPLFPALNVLAIYGVDLGEGGLGLTTLELLLRRRTVGVLNMKSCRVKAHSVAGLRQVSPESDIIWDQKEDTILRRMAQTQDTA